MAHDHGLAGGKGSDEVRWDAAGLLPAAGGRRRGLPQVWFTSLMWAVGHRKDVNHGKKVPFAHLWTTGWYASAGERVPHERDGRLDAGPAAERHRSLVHEHPEPPVGLGPCGTGGSEEGCLGAVHEVVRHLVAP